MSITGTSPGAYACNIAIKQMIEEYGEEQINNFKGEIFISYVINNLLYGDSAK